MLALYRGVKWLWRNTDDAYTWGIVARRPQCKRKFCGITTRITIDVSHCQTNLRLSRLTSGCILVSPVRRCFVICLINLMRLKSVQKRNFDVIDHCDCFR
jgi:hypothetical protein